MSRIAELPRRDWREAGEEAVRELTPLFLEPGATGRLRPIQAMAIKEGFELGGCLVNARVGAGKTLIAGLLATLHAERRPLIIVPGGHQEKTDREFAQYRAAGWKMPHTHRVVTYNELGRAENATFFDSYFQGEPGCIICDEVDKFRRVTKAACARRIARFMAANPETAFFGMTGTLFKEGLLDFAHMLAWALGEGAPVPLQPGEQQDWHAGLKGDFVYWPKMAHHLSFDAEDIDGAGPAPAFRDRLFYTPGVIISTDSFTDVELFIAERELDNEPVRYAIRRLHETGTTPDGWDTDPDEAEGKADEGPGSTWSAERQLALGFYYTPDPPPPAEWLAARKRYMGFVRAMIKRGWYDTEYQVRQACIKGKLDPTAWDAWYEIKDTFTPSFKPVWLSDHAIEECKEWGREPGIVWVDHRAFAARLSAETGWRWFSNAGLDKNNQVIDLASGDETVIASRFACGTGRNLQQWNRALLTACPGNGRDLEQVAGRQHREGQLKDCHLDVLIGCPVHERDLKKALALSEEECNTLMRRNKMLTATWL